MRPIARALRFRRRADLLDFLLEVASTTAETLTDLDRLLASVGDIVQQIIPYELLAIMLWSERLQGLRIRYAIGHRDEVVKNLLVRLGEGLTGIVAATRQPLLVGDVRGDPRYLNALDAVRSELAVPMLARGKLVGVIDLQSTQLHAYSNYDRAMLALIASRVVSAIDNARLYRRVDRQNRTLRLLAQLSQEFSSILNLDELLTHIAGEIKALIRYDAFSILLVDEAAQCLRHRFSLRLDQRVNLDNIPLGKGITGAAWRSREPVRADNTLADPRYIPSHPDIRSEVAVPLMVRGRVIGVMDLESERLAYFTDEHVRMLALLAPQVAISVENARLYSEVADREKRIEQDLEAARELQESMLPKRAPDIPGLQIAIGHRPARIIGGDLYDFFDLPEERALIALGDVSGKGVAAALYGALISGLLRTLAPRRREPAPLLRALNDALIERKVDARFVCALLLSWDPAARRFLIGNSGLPFPLICRGGEVLQPRVAGVPPGLLPGSEYEQIALQVAPGDVVVLYSDGVSDQFNPAGEEYGRRRLRRLLKTVCPATPQAVVEAVLADLDRFAESAPVFDDQTLLVLRVSP